MTKILYITNGINGSGGLERVLSIKASYLAEHYPYEIHILCLNDGDKKPFYVFSAKIHFHSISVSGHFLTYIKTYKKEIQKTVEEIQPNIISVCDDGLKGFFVPRIVKDRAKIIYERHASAVLNAGKSLKGKVIYKIMQRQVSRFDRFVVLTSGNIEEWSGDNVIVIPNPLSFVSEETASLTAPKVTAVGAHSYNKGYDLLLKAWVRLTPSFPAWELHIYGKIDAEKTFIRQAKKKNLKHLYFHEPVKNIMEKYLTSSVMVLSSRSEGFGMVLIEAMACGVPCVSFNCPSGPADIVTEGEDGFLVEPENVTQLAKKMALLMEEEALRKKMGHQAKENVKRYAVENIVRQWDELFQRLLM